MGAPGFLSLIGVVPALSAWARPGNRVNSGLIVLLTAPGRGGHRPGWLKRVDVDVA
jgi:hypothetical protein